VYGQQANVQQYTRNYNPYGLVSRYAGPSVARAQNIPQTYGDVRNNPGYWRANNSYRPNVKVDRFSPFYWQPGDVPGTMGFQLGQPYGPALTQRYLDAHNPQQPQQQQQEQGYAYDGGGGYGGGGYGGGGGGGYGESVPRSPEWYEAMVNWRYGR
jgi:hypothetical protein